MEAGVAPLTIFQSYPELYFLYPHLWDLQVWRSYKGIPQGSHWTTLYIRVATREVWTPCAQRTVGEESPLLDAGVIYPDPQEGAGLLSHNGDGTQVID